MPARILAGNEGDSMVKISMLSAVIGFVILGLLGCSKKEEAKGTVVATVNGEDLTLNDLIYMLPPEYRSQLRAEGLDAVVDNWINTEVLYQKALEKGLDNDPEVKALIRAGIREAIARKMIDEELGTQVDVPQWTIDSLYHLRQDSFKLEKDRFRVKHILLATEGEAKAIYNRLEKGADFDSLAGDYSIDRRSAERGGDIGYFTADDIDPAFVSAVERMKVGSYSRPVETPYGYHIIMLTDRQKAGAALDSLEAKQNIADSLYTERHAAAFQNLLDSLKSSAKIQKFPLTDSMITSATAQIMP